MLMVQDILMLSYSSANSSGITKFAYRSYPKAVYTVAQRRYAKIMQYCLWTQQENIIIKLSHENPSAEAVNVY